MRRILLKMRALLFAFVSRLLKVQVVVARYQAGSLREPLAPVPAQERPAAVEEAEGWAPRSPPWALGSWEPAAGDGGCEVLGGQGMPR